MSSEKKPVFYTLEELTQNAADEHELGSFLRTFHAAAYHGFGDAELLTYLFMFDKGIDADAAAELAKRIITDMGSLGAFLFAPKEELLKYEFMNGNNVYLVEMLRVFTGDFFLKDDPDGSWLAMMSDRLEAQFKGPCPAPTYDDVADLLLHLYCKVGDEYVRAYDVWDKKFPVDIDQFRSKEQ